MSVFYIVHFILLQPDHNKLSTFVVGWLRNLGPLITILLHNVPHPQYLVKKQTAEALILHVNNVDKPLQQPFNVDELYHYLFCSQVT